MIRTQISLSEEDYEAAKREAERLGISLAELLRRSLKAVLPADDYHALFRKLFADPPSLMTCASVIAEAHGWFLRRYDQTKALQFLLVNRSAPRPHRRSIGHPPMIAGDRQSTLGRIADG